MSTPETPSYQPFPSFAEWSGVVVDAATFDRYAAVLDDLRTRPDSALAKAVEVATRAAAIDMAPAQPVDVSIASLRDATARGLEQSDLDACRRVRATDCRRAWRWIPDPRW